MHDAGNWMLIVMSDADMEVWLTKTISIFSRNLLMHSPTLFIVKHCLHVWSECYQCLSPLRPNVSDKK